MKPGAGGTRFTDKKHDSYAGHVKPLQGPVLPFLNDPSMRPLKPPPMNFGERRGSRRDVRKCGKDIAKRLRKTARDRDYEIAEAGITTAPEAALQKLARG